MRRWCVAWLLCLSGCLFTADQVEPIRSSSDEAGSPSAVFDLLKRAYQTRSVALLDRLLADDYVFHADPASVADPASANWGKQTEMERHQRMFQAISNVEMRLRWDSLHPVPESAPRETTWTVWGLEMDMDLDGAGWKVEGGADFRLRAEPLDGGGIRYRIVGWTDRN